jgi:hypothetical protein
MHRDPLANTDTNTRKLPVSDPNASEAFATTCLNAKPHAQFNECILNPAKMPVQILTAGPQIQQRVAYKLARPVPRGLPAAPDNHKRSGKSRWIAE